MPIVGNPDAIAWSDDAKWCLWHGHEMSPEECRRQFGTEHSDIDLDEPGLLLLDGEVLYASDPLKVVQYLQESVRKEASTLTFGNLIHGRMGETTEKYVRTAYLPFLDVVFVHPYDETKVLNLAKLRQFNADLASYYDLSEEERRCRDKQL